MPDGDPKDYLREIDFESFREALKQRESSGDYSAVNRLGYVGAYQFGAAALEDIGLLKRGASRGGNAALKDPSNWKLRGGLAAFLGSDSTQDDAFERLAKLNAKRLANKKLLPDNPENIAAALAMAHLGGTGNVEKYLLDSDSSFEDANGTKLVEYEELGAESQRRGEKTSSLTSKLQRVM